MAFVQVDAWDTEVWSAVKPDGTALALLTVACVFSFLVMIVLPLRFYIRVSTRCLGFEDWLMFAGFVSQHSRVPLPDYG